MALKSFVNVSTVSQLLNKGIINRDGVRLLDCTYAVSQKLDWKQFEKELYGKFDVLADLPTPSKRLYLSAHIPEAVHLSLDAAMYPSKYERFTMYPPELFEKYIQLVGLNKDEHLIFYSRGALGGMMFAAKFAWLFRSYGHEKVSIIDGGFAQWQKAGLDVSQDDVKLKPGNWRAQDKILEHNIKFEELETEEGKEYVAKTEEAKSNGTGDTGSDPNRVGGSNTPEFVQKDDAFVSEDDVKLKPVKENKGNEYITKTDEVNFLDSRIRGQFNGTEDTGLDPYRVNGSHIPGFKNCPSSELVTADGTIMGEEDVQKWLSTNGFTPNQPIVTNCNTGMQASLLSYVIQASVKDARPRLYNGSLKEMEMRDPKRISAGPPHIPH